MNAKNAEIYADLASIVEQMPSGDPDACRAVLLGSNSEGQSIVEQFRARHASGPKDIGGSRLRAENLLGALHGDVAET